MIKCCDIVYIVSSFKKIVKVLWDSGGEEVNQEVHFEYDTELHQAVRNNDFESVRELCFGGALTSEIDRMGCTALHLASAIGNLDIVEVLYKYGSKVNETDFSGSRPIHWAAENGHVKVIEYLHRKHARFDVKNNDGLTPLHLAARSGHYFVVTYLCRVGCLVNAVDRSQSTPLHLAAKNGYLKIVQYLSNVNKPEIIEANDEFDFRKALFNAIQSQAQLILSLSDKSLSPDLKDKTGSTAIYWAAVNGHVEVVDHLLSIGADKAQLNRLSVPYQEIGKKKPNTIIGCNFANEIDENGLTALHWATTYEDFDFVNYLLRVGAHLDQQNDNGLTPFHLAALNGYFQMIEYFCKKGVCVDKISDCGWSAIDFAAVNGHLEIVEYLHEKGCKLNESNIDGQLTLRLAVDNGYINAKVLDNLMTTTKF